MTDGSVLELFRVEAENQVAQINQGLIDLERDAANGALLESLMRAAHSIKGAARIVKLPAAVTLAHAMEDCFVALQKGARLPPEGFDTLLAATDRFGQIARVASSEVEAWLQAHAADFEALATGLRQIMAGGAAAGAVAPDVARAPPGRAQPPAAAPVTAPPAAAESPPVNGPVSGPAAAPERVADDRMLRIHADHLDRIMGLAAETVAETHGLAAVTQTLLRLRRQQDALARQLAKLQEDLRETGADEAVRQTLRDIERQQQHSRELLMTQEERAGALEQRLSRLAQDLYREATASRMRGFADGISGFPRMVRDLARELGKDVRLEISGAATQVDRDILEALQAPLNHLVRNAVDHAIEPAPERVAAGKPATGTVWLDARHRAGMLQVTIRDDGRGIDGEAIRTEVIRRGMVTADLARELSEAELFDFLFLPNFTLSPRVTEISGRGVGLNIVQNAVQRVRGAIKADSEPGRGATFQLQLPLTLSVLRGLVVTIADEAYAFPLARVERVLNVPAKAIKTLEGREYFEFDGVSVGLIAVRQLLRLPVAAVTERFPVVLFSDHAARYGLVVDRLQTECELVVQPIDPVLGRLRNIAAAALLDSGAPVMIFDMDDVSRSIDSLIASGQLNRALPAAAGAAARRKQVLVVDDSFTVREVERKLLENQGYRVAVAVDGMEGWHAIRGGGYDLIITDIDMPRMNGIELVELVRKDPRLAGLPVMIVSYKDREEDRQRGLEAGADYYLTKSSFQDETLLEAVETLIGAA